jgi:O-antigen/teichoic acid export membrane protein
LGIGGWSGTQRNARGACDLRHRLPSNYTRDAWIIQKPKPPGTTITLQSDLRRMQPSAHPGLPLPGRPDVRPRSLSGDAGLLTLGSLFSQGAQIVSLSVVARLVAKSQIATYQQCTLLYGIIAPLLLAGVPAGLLYFMSRAKSDEERRVWISRAYLLLMAMGIVSFGGVIALRRPLASLLNNPGLAPALVLYAPYLLFAFIAAATPPALIASGRARGAALLNACMGTFLLLSLVTAAIVHPTGQALVLALSVAAALLAIVSVAMVWRTVGISWPDPHRWSGLRQLFGYGLPLALTGLTGMVGFQIDRIVVGANFSPRVFTIYALGAVEVPIGLLLAMAVGNVLVPELATRWRNGDRAGMIALWRESMRKTSLILFPLFIFLMVMANDVVRVLYGPGYGQSVAVFRIYLFLIPVRIATWGLIPQAVGRTSINLLASVVILVTNVVIAFSLVYPLGITGPAIAGPASAVLTVLYYLLRVRSVVETNARNLLPLRSLAVTMLLAVVSALPLLGLLALHLPSILRLASGLPAFVFLSVTTLRLTRQIDDEDWKRMRSTIARLRPAELSA